MAKFSIIERICIKWCKFINGCTSLYLRFYYNLHPLITIGSGTFIERGAKLISVSGWGYGGHIKIGKNCYIGRGVMLVPQGGDIVLGDNTSVNPNTILFGMGGLTIGNDVRIGPRCVIVPQNHNYIKKEIVIDKQGMTSKGVIIENDVWLGTGVVVLDGVVVRKGCVLGASTIVTKSTENYGVYVGNPAKLIKYRE